MIDSARASDRWRVRYEDELSVLFEAAQGSSQWAAVHRATAKFGSRSRRAARESNSRATDGQSRLKTTQQGDLW